MIDLKQISTEPAAAFPDKARLFAINDEAFPEWERIPSERLLAVMHEYGCTPWAIYSDGQMVGFTSVMYSEDYKIAYIWFLAIAPDCRGCGFGSETLQALRQKYHDAQLVLDMEQIDPRADNYAQRVRRLHFYERGGFARAFMSINYFGMDFELMSSPAPLRLVDFKAMLTQMPGRPFRPRFYPIENLA